MTMISKILIFLIITTISLSNITIISHAAASDDANTLIKFKESINDEFGSLNSWATTTYPCFGPKNNWAGVICSRGGSIWGLRLEHMRLKGLIDVDSLAQLPRLRSISVTGNGFGGQMPDFKRLRSLKTIYLSHNNFEDSIPSNAFEGMRRLRKVHLEYNQFSGDFPSSLATLSKLVELRLEGNRFHGSIPDFKLSTSLHVFNVSNNELKGPIPASLSTFDVSAFLGNKELCGPPIPTCLQTPLTAPPPPPPPPSSSTSANPMPIIAITLGVIIAMILAITVIILVFRSHRQADKNNMTSRSRSTGHRKNVPKGDIEEGSHRSVGGGRNNNNNNNGKLTFIRDNEIDKFDLPDLLKASAEILGSGCFGSSYKATLSNGNTMVVKRFKKMNNVGRDDFQEHMRRLGRLDHPNLLNLVAYYYRKEEKLFITSPIEMGSLGILLHGHTKGKTLDWPTRLKIIKGVVNGLRYLYKELPILVAPHGHLKSSNVLLKKSYDPVLSDYGLIPLINQESVQEMMVAYKSPEYFNNGRVTKKTDVWALGILILEILTLEFPSMYLQQGSEVDMSSWVKSVVDQGFDKNMVQTRNSEGEIGKLLQIGVACCDTNVEKRLDIKDALERIEDIRERDHDDDFYSTCSRGSRGMSDDFTLNIN